MKQINIACKAADTLPLEKLTVIQGDLKSLSDSNSLKLKNSILKYGFSAPIFVWESGVKKPKYNVLDGTQRLSVLKVLKSEGYKIPLLPVVYIQAKNKKEALGKLLHITSQYGEFEREGLDIFLLGIDADEEFLQTIRLANDEMTFKIEENDKSITEIEYKKKMQLVIDFKSETKMKALYGELVERDYQCTISTL